MPYKDPEARRAYNMAYKADNKSRLRPLEIARTRANRTKLNLYIQNVKAKAKCEICDEAEDVCLDFHHRNPKEKRFMIAVAANMGYSIENLEAEIAKCSILCSNCHRKLHAGLVSVAARQVSTL